MTDATNQSPPAEPGAQPGAAPPSGDAPAALTKPDFLPAQYWDDKAGIKTDDFAKHYGELSTAQQKLAERGAAVPPNPDGYKPEIKFAEGFKVPEGLKFDPSKDPRWPVLSKVAHELGLTNAEVSRIVTLDAEMAIQSHQAEQTRIAEETKKLGDKANDRIAAVTNWVKGLAEKGDLTAEEQTEARMAATTAAGVSLLEKLMAKANGGIPGHVPTNPKVPEPPLTDRWYGTQQKAS